MIKEPTMSLLDVGTRWKHYGELRELFSIGLEIVKHLNVRSLTDMKKQKQLEGAIELMDKRIELLADFQYGTAYGSTLYKTINGDVDNIYKGMKKGREDAAKEEQRPDEDNEGPADYTTK